jgi:glycosyltransferase involved in cell wall biosynthesis
VKIAVITCYDQNDYVRAKSLRAGFAAVPGAEVIVVKNSRIGLLRYLEVPLKLLKLRFFQRPDVYVLTFRGYETLPLLLLLKGRKPLIFDEFINAAEYLAEHNKLRPDSRTGKVFRWWYGSLLRRCRVILADTEAHADYSSELCGVPRDRYLALPVAADETLFRPRPAVRPASPAFTVFYYGNGMTPLHGLQLVLDAAVMLKDNARIRFNVVGGKLRAEQACATAVEQGARLTYEAWIPFEEIAKRASAAGLCLGGPFGKTLQSQFVITGKTYQFLAAGAPVLVGANKVSGLFKDKANCLLVPQHDAEGIRQAILWASTHPEELTEIGHAGRALYETHFSQNVINRQLAILVEKLRT